MSTLTDVFAGITGAVSSVADTYVKLNQASIDRGMASQSNTIDELKNSITLMQMQAQMQAQYAQQSATSLAESPILKWALVAGGLFLAYKLIK